MKFYLIRLIFLLGFAGVSTLVLSEGCHAGGLDSVAYYRGFYFEIAYPKNFIAKPLEPVSQYDGFVVETDEAYFGSPDGAVEFFVYSPSWSGRPKNYLKILPTEKLISQENKKQVKVGAYRDQVLIGWTTVKAKDGSYTRSFVHIKNRKSDLSDSDLDRVFGIKYKSQAAYDQYREAYHAFKKSLKQFSD